MTGISNLEATPRLELGVELLQSSALPLGYVAGWGAEAEHYRTRLSGAGDEARTRYLHLGKVALYQMSYTCAAAKTYLCPPNAFYAGFLNRYPADTREYPPGPLVPPAGIEPATRGFSVPCSTN